MFAPAEGYAAKLTLAAVGERPAIAVDDAGTGHIVWTDPDFGADRLVYCRLPRGASSCASQQVFALADTDFAGPRVLVAGSEVVLVTTRCCGSYPSARAAVLALHSSDGGTTFSGPTVIGDNDLFHGDVAFGPGFAQVSSVGAPTEGVLFQATPLSGPQVPYTERALLLGGTAPASISSVTMADPLTPAVGYSDFANSSFARIYDGSGSYNDAANWLAPTPPLSGDDSQLAGGLRGLYMIRRTGPPSKWRYVVDRYDPLGQFFGSTAKVSPKGDPIFRDLIEDAGGNLHAVWVQNDERHEPLLYSASADGETWRAEPKKLATVEDNGFNLQVGAGSDGGGWAVWTTESGGGTVHAAPFAPIGAGGGGACVPSVTVGKVVALATQGCFKKKGDEHTTSGSVRINGLDLSPEGGAKLTIDKGKGTLVSTGKFLIKAGPVELDTSKLEWKLPKSGGQLKDLAGNPAVFDAAKANVEFLSLPVSGWVSPSFTGGAGTDLPVNLELPDPLGSLLGSKITGETTLRLDNANGLILSGAKLAADSVFLGIAEVQDLLLTYVSDPFVLQGSAVIVLPVVKSKLDPVQFGLRDGAFEYGTASLVFDDPGRPVSSFAFLRSIDFAVNTDPTRIAGGVTATGGPTLTLGGTPYAAVTVDGNVSYTFTDPGEFLAQGTGKIFNINAAQVSARYVTSGLLSLAGNFSIPAPPLELNGSVTGEVSLTNGAFNLEGTGSGCGLGPIPGCVPGITVLVSSKAAAGCVEGLPVVVDPTSIPPEVKELSGGIAWIWESGFKPFAGCDLSPYEVSVSRAEARAARRGGGAGAAGTALGVNVGEGAKQVNLAIKGQGAPPLVTITGPGGETVSSAANPNGSATGTAGIITQSDADDTAYAALLDPAPGTWTIDPQPGSSPVVEVSRADLLPEPKVKARVRKAGGRKRVLAYEVKKIPGQRVTFVEVGSGSAKLIGRAQGKSGKLRFSAADGPGGPRTIEAHVESFGVPRAALEVDAYRAPPPIKPRKPRQLNLRRQGTKLLVSWQRAKYAKRYLVQAKLRDGRVLAITTRKTRAKIKRVPGIDAGTIRVAGLKADNTHGKVAKARLKAKPKRRKPR